MAMTAEVKREGVVAKLARKAPANTAASMELPRTNTSAMARPVGGQTGVTLALSEANKRLARASRR